MVYLATKLFKEGSEGQELLNLLKAFHLKTPTFPLSPRDLEKMDRHGGALAWAAFREGNLDMIRKLEMMSESHDYLKEEEVKK